MAAVLSVAAGAAAGQDHVEGAYTVSSILPGSQDENGELRESSSSVICTAFVSGLDLDQYMNLMRRHFGEDVVLEEAYPHIRCKNAPLMPVGHPEIDLYRTILEYPRPMIPFLKQMMYYFRNNAKHKDFLGKVLMCRVKHTQGCMDYFERINRLIVKNQNANQLKMVQFLRGLKQFYLERTPGPLVRDAEFCQEILHEPPQCRDQSVSWGYGTTPRYEGSQDQESE